MENNLKAITFSLYGDNPKYTIGLLKNIELAKLFYPGWLIYVYYDFSVPKDIISKLKNNPYLHLKNMSNYNLPGMFWRFLIHDEHNVSLFIVRDTDSRISLRESLAVHEWINSNKKLHIMRDHPHHNFKILGGMWGLRVNKNLIMANLVKNFLDKKYPKYDVTTRGIDQDFLKDYIYNRFLFSRKIHASYHKKELFTSNFPVDLYNKHFVGEVFDENDIRGDQYKEI
jgi:hypothetical protein